MSLGLSTLGNPATAGSGSLKAGLLTSTPLSIMPIFIPAPALFWPKGSVLQASGTLWTGSA